MESRDEKRRWGGDERWKYGWDAENRLVTMEERTSVHRPIGAPPRKRLTFTYDHRHRRVAKTVHEWDAATSSFTRLVKSLRFVYDDWNMIAELDATACPATGLAGSRLARTFVWGSDISAQAASPFSHASNQGAGGVGGLLAVNHQGTSYFPCADANGNTMGLFNASSGTLTARYDYSPFGERITDTGPAKHGGGKIEISPFGFSTKYVDEETSLVYYGFRYYSPEMGRWLNRDPIGERGGLNLYGMVGNDAVNRRDYLGLKLIKTNDCEILIFIGHSRTMFFSFSFDIAPRSYLSLLTCDPEAMNRPIPSGNLLPNTPSHNGKLYPQDPNDANPSPQTQQQINNMNLDNGGKTPAQSPSDEHSTREALNNLMKDITKSRDDLCCRGCKSVLLIIENEMKELAAIAPTKKSQQFKMRLPCKKP